ncbi:hypothetical protein N3K66_002679 [Trichothecium roseum]|uniref:Uncharacterized protein n=1 Tax=Trichothecium roseum TaxID=47278 RepID=A0ACC0VA67_9HYPO|nr:hypothetical protein N3K66_002679 [Trichothecium roseum]
MPVFPKEAPPLLFRCCVVVVVVVVVVVQRDEATAVAAVAAVVPSRATSRAGYGHARASFIETQETELVREWRQVRGLGDAAAEAVTCSMPHFLDAGRTTQDATYWRDAHLCLQSTVPYVPTY